MDSRYLEFREGNSDKFYRIVAMQSGSDWITTVWWGRRGSDGQTQIKYSGPSEAAAKGCMDDLAYKKRAKGYADALDPLRPASTPATPPTVYVPSTRASTLTIPGVPRFPAMKAAEKDVNWTSMAATDSWVLEEKFDGHRGGLTFNPDGTIVIRNVYGEDKGKIENTPHIKQHLQAIERTCGMDLYEGTLIDGELVGLTLQETTHLLGAGGRADPRLKFVAFDLPFLAGQDLRKEPWHFRRALLVSLIDDDGLGPITVAETFSPSRGVVMDIWQHGGEGAILKPVEAPYVPASRAYWVKIKEHHTAEAVVTGWAPGAGKYNNQLGALKLSQYRGGVLTEVTQVSGMTDAVRKQMTNQFGLWLNRVVEFEYQKKTADSYRHPRYVRPRPDKRATDCTWEASA